jgi:hypothetical protein
VGRNGVRETRFQTSLGAYEARTGLLRGQSTDGNVHQNPAKTSETSLLSRFALHNIASLHYRRLGP